MRGIRRRLWWVAGGRPAGGPVTSATVAAVLAVLVVGSPAVSTTSGDGPSPDARYYRSTVRSVDPPTPGIEIVVRGGGQSVTLTNRSRKTVVVLGYAGEPYLRISSRGVDENINSLTAALTDPADPHPTQLAAGIQPQPQAWRHRTDRPAYTWRDHRVQWTVTQRPPIVAADPRHSHTVFEWAIQMTVDRQPVLVRGTVYWVGVPEVNRTQAVVLVAGGAVLLIALLLMFLLVLRRHRRRSTRQRQSARRGGRYRAGGPVDAPVPASSPVAADSRPSCFIDLERTSPL